MKKQFLKDLNRELRPLKKEERKKCLDNYEEIIMDKIDSGISEKTAVLELESPKQVAKEILNLYVELDEETLYDKPQIFNIAYVIFDIIVLIISYLLAYYICFISGLFEIFHSGLPFYYYIFSLILIIPSYVILYVRFKLYTVNCVRKKSYEAWNIFCANFIGLIFFALVLYLFKQYYFSRMMLGVFFCINVITGIIVRNLIFNRFYSFKNKLDSSSDYAI